MDRLRSKRENDMKVKRGKDCEFEEISIIVFDDLKVETKDHGKNKFYDVTFLCLN